MQVHKRGQVAASMMPREFRLLLATGSVPSRLPCCLGPFFFRIRQISFSVTPRELETRLQRVVSLIPKKNPGYFNVAGFERLI
jgi:hypothetical protein